MSEKWTDKLPSLMEGYEEAAPEGLWDAVQAGLAPKKRLAGWWYAAGGLLAAAAVVVLAVFLWNPRPQEPSVVPGEVLASVETPEPTPLVEPAPVVEPEAPALKQVFPTLKQVFPVEESVQNEEPAPVPEPTPVAEPAPVAEPEVADTPRPTESVELQRQPEPVLPPSSQKKKERRVQLQLSSGGLLAQAGSVTNGYGVPNLPGMYAYTKASGGNLTVPLLSRNRPSVTTATHRQSLRLHLGVQYGFLPRLSAGTGITYTVLRSDFVTESGNTTSSTTRHIHYLGIPLNLQFKVLEWKRLSLLAVAGPLFEASVGARVNTRSYVGNVLMDEQQGRQALEDFRWSVNAGIGIQYQLFRYGALFLQPGMSYYFKHTPEDEVESFYSAHPLSFDFTFGYRFTF